jgi:tetratricopeptide (TPR) repeat protein
MPPHCPSADPPRRLVARAFCGCVLILLCAAAASGKDMADVCQPVASAPAADAGRALKACVDAIRDVQSKGNAEDKKKAKEWIEKTRPTAAAAAQAATAVLPAGRIEEAKAWCDAAIFVDISKISTCAPVNDAWNEYRADLYKLQQARSDLQKQGFTAAENILGPLRAEKKFPAIASEAIAISKAALAAMSPDVQLGLQYKILGDAEKARQKCDGALTANPADANAFQCVQAAMQSISQAKQAADDQKNWSIITTAKALNADGQHAAAVKNLSDLLGQSGISPAVAQSAREALIEARTNSGSVFRDALKSQWIMQFMAALAIVAGVWFGLHFIRWCWRMIYGKLWARMQPIQWAFLGVQDKGELGASDAVLDALRRVPNEVKQPIWTPGALILHDTGHGLEVWEDLGVTVRPKPFREKLTDLLVTQGQAADNALVDAFQNLQFNVGTVSLPVVAKFWRAVMDWWRDGQPAFTGAAQEAPTADNLGKQVVIRLTCAGGRYGTVSVLASTRKDNDVDTLSLTASRAAYKLLSRMSSSPESVEQIDGHAAFRQGAKTLSCYVRSVADAQADPARVAELGKAIANLEFARQVFCRDESHRAYYLQALRFEAIAQALLGHAAPAITRLEELEDEASRPETPTFQWMAVEAAFNQGVLHLSLAKSDKAGTDVAQHIQLADRLFESMQAASVSLAKAAVVCRAAALTANGREGWPQLTREDCAATLDALEQHLDAIDQAAAAATGDDRRAYSALATEGRRNLAIGRLRSMAAFDIQGLGPFDATPQALTPQGAKVVAQCLSWFEKSDSFGSATLDALVCRAYALLLSPGDRWRAAEYYAKQALAIDKTCQFACYIAAEACRQRLDDVSANFYITALTTAIAPNPITDPSLCRLNRALNPPAVAAAAAASCG